MNGDDSTDSKYIFDRVRYEEAQRLNTENYAKITKGVKNKNTALLDVNNYDKDEVFCSTDL